MLARGLPLWLSVAAALGGCGGNSGSSADAGDDGRTGRQTRPADGKNGPRAAAAAMRPRPGETFGAQVVRPVALRSRPAPDARRVGVARRRTEFDSPRIMAVLRQRGRWLGVAAPEVPNGRVAWVRRDRVRILRELYRIDVDISERRAVLRRKGRRVASFPVAVGAPATPTPPGRYGVTDRLDTGGAGSTYGCCVLALSGNQPNVPQEWPGGDRLAIHGTNAPSTIGRAASNGCLRASERTMRLLIAKVPIGTQVIFRR